MRILRIALAPVQGALSEVIIPAINPAHPTGIGNPVVVVGRDTRGIPNFDELSGKGNVINDQIMNAIDFGQFAGGRRHDLRGRHYRLSISYNVELAAGFEVTARCPDGIIEAIESSLPDWFVMGIQFHPESDTAPALDMRIFEEFLMGVKEGREAMRLVA